MPEEDLFPKSIGRYEIKRLLGAGAMGSVYLAEDPRIKRRIAIKMVKADLLSSEMDRHEVLARFQREAEVSGLLNHPGIVAIFDFGESDYGTFLAMEFVEGRPLDEIIKSGEAFSFTERYRMLLGIGEALDHAHTKGIVHRDVKPGNIMIALDGKPKLMDFGIAKREDASLTQTGTFLGTPSYASPEQIREVIVDNRSDIFSFGVMAFEVFVGKTPFPGSSINTILYKIVNEPPAMPDPPLEGVFPDTWKKIFEKVLAKRPQDRFGTCGEFLDELGQAFVALDPSVKSKLEQRTTGAIPLFPSGSSPLPAIQTASNTLKSTPTRRGPKLAALGGVVALLGGIGFWLSRGPKASAPSPSSVSTAPAQAPPAAPPKAPEPTKVAAPAGPAVPEVGTLKFSGSFPVRVKLEGRDLGECQPGKSLELPAGTHQIELSNPRVFYRESRRSTITSGKTTPLALPALASVTVYTFPGSGMVTVDGQLTSVESIGEKTLSISHGRHVFGIQGRSVQHAEDIHSDGQQVKFGGIPAQ